MTRAAGLFGRDEELWAVRQALDGRGCVIAGPPGVGKSRLAADAAAGLGPDHTLIRVVASSAAGTIPFDAVSHLLLANSASAIVEIVAAVRDGRLGPAPVLLVDDAHLLDDASAALVLAIATSGVAPPRHAAHPRAGPRCGVDAVAGPAPRASRPAAALGGRSRAPGRRAPRRAVARARLRLGATYVLRVYRKLGINDRAALAEVLRTDA